MYTDEWINPPYYYPLYDHTCYDCGAQFDSNEEIDDLCDDCKQNRDDQIIIAGEILELVSQLKYPIDCQEKFTNDLELLVKEIEWEE